MPISRDRRSVAEQAKSGLKIAAALLARLATIALLAFAYLKITKVEDSQHVLAGWMLMAALVVIFRQPSNSGVDGSIFCPVSW